MTDASEDTFQPRVCLCRIIARWDTSIKWEQQRVADWRKGRNGEANGHENFSRWIRYAPLLSRYRIELFEKGSWSAERFPPRRAVRNRQEPGLHRLYDYVPAPSHLETYTDDSRVVQEAPLVHPAQSADGRWLMLRIVRVIDDGIEHLDILRYVSSLSKQSDSRNHCLPMVLEISEPDITFAAFQYMSAESATIVPGFYNLNEVLEFMEQTMEGLVFLHDNGIVHRDIAYENIVWNLAGPCQPPELRGTEQRTPWRSQFRIRYFFIDFEYAVMFPAGPEASDRKIEGLPSKNFSRFCPREYLSGVRFDPFASDVWCIGLIYWDHFRQIEDPAFQALFEPLLRSHPAERPTAEEALSSIREFRRGVTDPESCLIGYRRWELYQTHPNAGAPPVLARQIEELREKYARPETR